MKKFLRNLGTVAALTTAVGANAQLPDFGVFPAAGYTVTDIDGVTHDLEALLDDGKAVLIDAFADWCPPCWTYHTGGNLEELYDLRGPDGTDELEIFGLEADPGEPEANISDAATGMGDWTLDGTVHYPLADDDNIAGAINLAYYPTLILVCPDRSTTEVGQVSVSAWEAAIDACPEGATLLNDPRVLGSSMTTELSVCGDGAASSEVTAVIQNFSADAISGTYTIEAVLDGDVVGTVDAELDLGSYEATEVSLGMVDFSAGANDVTIRITTDNDDTSNDELDVTVNVNVATDLGIGDLYVTGELDAYGSEHGIALAEGVPTISDIFEAYPLLVAGTYPGVVEFYPIGTWADGDAGYEHAYPGLAEGCYHMIIVDNYGDGLLSGGITVASPNSSLDFTVSGDFGYGGPFLFEITTAGTGGFVGIEEASVVEFAEVYPNPATNVANVQITLAESADVTVQLVNAVGQVVYTNAMGSVTGQQTVAVDAASLESGIYLVNITVDNNVITKRLSIVK